MKAMKREEFLDFCKGKKVYTDNEAIKEFYGNNYKTFRESVNHIYFEQTAYHDTNYYYDKEKNIIIEESYYIGD